MSGLNWSYNQLCEYIPWFTVTDLNPVIHKIFTSCHGSSVIAVGGHSLIFQIADGIAAKVPDYDRWPIFEP